MKRARFSRLAGIVGWLLVAAGLAGVALAQEPVDPFEPLEPVFPEVIIASYAEWPPAIDGAIEGGEWEIDNRVEFEHGFLTVLNDAIRLYILVDVLSDSGEDPVSSNPAGDFFVLGFDVNKDGTKTSADLEYVLVPGTANMRYRHCIAPGTVVIGEGSGYAETTRSSYAAGFDCFIADRSRDYRAFTHPKFACVEHRVWELAIDLREIGAEPGDLVHAGVRVSSQNPAFTEDVPEGFYFDFEEMIVISLAPVPEEVAETIPATDPHASLRLDETIEPRIPSLGEPGRLEYAIEVTQATQDRQNSLPVVAEKPAVARVYVETTGTSDPQPAIVCLYGTQDGADLPGSPLALLLLGAPRTIDRGRLNDTANFLLPASWTQDTVEFHASVSDLSGDEHDASTPFSISFHPKEAPVYWVIPIKVITPAGEFLPLDDDITVMESYLEAVYPVPDVQYVNLPWDTLSILRPCRGGGCLKAGAIGMLNNYYDSLVMAESLGSERPDPFPDQLFGVIYEPGGRSDPTWSPFEPGRGLVAVGNVGYSGSIDHHAIYNDFTMAHEINHNLDRASELDEATWGRHVGNPDPCMWHVCVRDSTVEEFERLGLPTCEGRCVEDGDPDWGCGGDLPDPEWPWSDDHLHEFGFDTRTPWVDGLEWLSDPGGYPGGYPADYKNRHFTVVPDSFPDFMSYCRAEVPYMGLSISVDPATWISPYRWRRLFAAFPEPSLFPDLFRRVQSVLYVSGTIDWDGTGRFDPAFQQPGIPSDNGTPGDYRLELQDPGGKPILTRSFSIGFQDLEGGEYETVHFHFHLPVKGEIGKLVLYKGKEILDVLEASKTPPTVTVLTPKAGEQWGSPHTIRWRAHDADGDVLRFTILYSPNQGKSWWPVAWSVEGDSYTVDSGLLPGGEGAVVRVIATDGLHTTYDDSDGPFTVFNNPPRAFITWPIGETTAAPGEPIVLEGDATDLEDGTLPDDAYIWSVDKTVFATGRRVTARLPVGCHTITLMVVDSVGETGYDTIEICAVPEQAAPSQEVPSVSGPLSVRVEASANPVCGEERSHTIAVSWVVTGAAAARAVIVETIGPDGKTQVHQETTLTGTKTYDLSYPGGGAVTVNVKVEATGASAQASTSVWLSACK